MPKPVYSWMISFADLQDEPIKRFADSYLTTHPDPSNNYYNLTAQALINFANQLGIDVSTLNAMDRVNNPPHALIIDWMICQFNVLVCQNQIGLNNDPVADDIWAKKYSVYNGQLKAKSNKISYETFFTAAMQQVYTRAGGGFRIIC